MYLPVTSRSTLELGVVSTPFGRDPRLNKVNTRGSSPDSAPGLRSKMLGVEYQLGKAIYPRVVALPIPSISPRIGRHYSRASL